MNDDQRRAHERKDSLNLLDYVALGADGNPVARGVGRTLNVSEEGLFIETHVPLSKDQRILLTIALEEDIVELQGRVIHVRESANKRFSSGIEFTALDRKGLSVLKKYLKAIRDSIGKETPA